MTGNLSGMENFETTPFGQAEEPSSPSASPGTGMPGRASQRRFIRWAAGIGAAALLAGGVATAASISSGPAAASSAQLTSSSSQSGSVQLTNADVQAAVPGLARDTSPATLRTCLARARALAQAGNETAARQARRACLGGLRLWLRGEHGTVTFQTKNGPVTVVWERGLVTSAPGTGTTFTVTAKDNTAWTWTLTSKTRIRQGGELVTAGSLALNSKVFVFGRVTGGADTAAIVRIAS